MKIIPLTQEKFTIVDDEDFESLSKHKWYFLKDRKGYSVGYAVRNIVIDGKRHQQSMHRLLLGLLPGEECDHRDGNGLHNWKSNLCKCSRSDNQRNRRLFKNNKTGVRGVYWNGNRFCVRIYRDGKQEHIASVTSLEEAKSIREQSERSMYPITCL